MHSFWRTQNPHQQRLSMGMDNVSFYDYAIEFTFTDLQIYNVKAASKDEMEGKEKKINKKMPPSVVKYQTENNVNVFLYSRPFRKTKKSTNEFRVHTLLSDLIRLILLGSLDK